jgi:hypothetical protein
MIAPCKRAMEGGNFGCAQAGCSQCLEKLICANEGLIHACLRQQVRGRVLYADLVQEGRIALWQAVRQNDPQCGTAFSTYAWIDIGNRVWSVVHYANQSNLWVNGEAPRLSIAQMAEIAYLKAVIQAALLPRLPCWATSCPCSSTRRASPGKPPEPIPNAPGAPDH